MDCAALGGLLWARVGVWRRVVARTKEIHIKTSKIIINKPTINGKEPHQRNHIPHFAQNLKHASGQLLLIKDRIDTNRKYHSPMQNIPKHNPKEKRKSNGSKNARIYLLVTRNTICICYLLSY